VQQNVARNIVRVALSVPMNLRDYLKATGQTIPQFAAKIRRSRSIVWRWVNGSLPDNEGYEAILQVTDGQVTPNDFFILPDLKKREAA
jgi:transcriptional regulator with XRE-family HTH domain